MYTVMYGCTLALVADEPSVLLEPVVLTDTLWLWLMLVLAPLVVPETDPEKACEWSADTPEVVPE